MANESHCRSKVLGGTVRSGEVRICTSENNSDVSVSMDVPLPYTEFLSDWTMKLQRYENGGWKTVGTRTGYLAIADPSNRTFTNVAITNKPMRVYVTFDFYNPLSSVQWIR